MRKTIVLTLCSFFLLSCSGGFSSSNGGISFPGTSSAATSSGGIPWGNTSSAQTTGGGGIPWGNTSSAPAPATSSGGGGGVPWRTSSAATTSAAQPTSQGGQTAAYPADAVRNFLNSYGVYDVTIPSFDAEAFNFQTTIEEGFPILLVEGWFSNQEKAANAGNGYLNTLNSAGVWTIYDYMDQGGYVVALHSNNKVAIQIGITTDGTRYALDTAIVVNTAATTTSQQQSGTGYEFLKEYPAQELANFMNSYGVGSVYIPRFTAELYDYYSEVIDSYPDFTVVGLYATEDAGVTGTNNFLAALNNDANWTLYNYWDSDGYFMAMHSGNQVAIMITYNYYKDINLYALEATVIINTSSQGSQAQATSGYDFLKEFPTTMLNNFLSNYGAGSVYVPQFTAEAYDFYTDTMEGFPALVLIGIYSTEDAVLNGINSYLTLLDNNSNWTLYNYWEENSYFIAAHSSNKVAMMITYYYYTDINLYGLEVTVVVNTGSATTSGQGSASYSTFYSTAGFPSSIISSFLANIGMGGTYFPTMTGASRYGYFMMSVPYTGTIVMDVLYVVCIFPSKDAAYAAINTYYNSLINAGLQCDYINSGGDPMLNGSSGSLIYVVMGTDPSYLPVNVNASTGEYVVVIGLTQNPGM